MESHQSAAAMNDGNAAPSAGEGSVVSIFQKSFSFFLKFLLVQSLVGFALNQFKSPDAASSTTSSTSNASSLAPRWTAHHETQLQWYLFVDTRPLVTFNLNATWIWSAEGRFGDWNFEKTETIVLDIPPQVYMGNESLYAHLFVVPNATRVGPKTEILYQQHELTKYVPRTSKRKVKLLEANTANFSNELLPDTVYYDAVIYPNFTVAIVTGAERIYPAQEPPSVLQYIAHIVRDGHAQYLPPLFVNEFWQLEDKYVVLNESVTTLNWTVSAYTLSLLKFRLYLQMEEQFRVQQSMMGSSGKEVSELKRVFMETNIYLLVLGFSVSLLHSAFDFLAFKNDVQFWKGKKDTVGLSLRAIILNIVFQAIILLYLLDNETSWMILLSSAVGLGIECWKLKRVIKIQVNFAAASFGKIITMTNRVPSKQQDETTEYDQQAFRYLSYFLYPCLALYALYSLMYQEHKSWYSYTLNTLVGFVYAFGFAAMTPQLFINYKLKSVAHMPWKTFVYKALNTVVDDIFSFIIKMPFLHRLAAFRDDVVFLVYLYQRYIYPVDKSRPNEYGQVLEPSEKKDQGLIEQAEAAKDRRSSPSRDVSDVSDVCDASIERTAAQRRPFKVDAQ